MRTLFLLLFLTAPLVGQSLPRPVRPTPCRTPAVPAAVPGSLPDSIYAPERMSGNRSPFMTGDFPRDVVFLSFTAEATQARKQAAVDSICGRVVGGIPTTRTYAVRVQDHPTAAVLFGAVELLESLPQVRSAFADAYLVAAIRNPQVEPCPAAIPGRLPATWSIDDQGSLSGRIRTNVGRAPIPGVEVDLWPLGSDGSSGPLYRTHSSEDGSFAFSGLSPGRYRVVVFHVDYWQLLGRIQVDRAAPAEAVDIRMSPSPICFG